MSNRELLVNSQQRIVEGASILAESNHWPDIYFYRFRNERLYSPTGKRYLEEITSGEADLSLVNHLQQWVKHNSAGTAVWLSPPLDEAHPETKITLFEIKAGNNYKVVENIARQVYLPNDRILELANLLTTYGLDPNENITQIESLRSKLFLILDKQGTQDLIQQITGQTANWDNYKKLINITRRISTTNNYLERLIPHMGNYSLSCPLVRTSRGSPTVKSEALHSGEKTLSCTCPFCQKKVEAKIADGKIHCPNCGQSAAYHC